MFPKWRDLEMIFFLQNKSSKIWNSSCSIGFFTQLPSSAVRKAAKSWNKSKVKTMLITDSLKHTGFLAICGAGVPFLRNSGPWILDLHFYDLCILYLYSESRLMWPLWARPKMITLTRQTITDDFLLSNLY